jgi:hypothetical protein
VMNINWSSSLSLNKTNTSVATRLITVIFVVVSQSGFIWIILVQYVSMYFSHPSWELPTKLLS